MIEKDVKLKEKVMRILDKEEMELLNTPIWEWIGMLVNKIEQDQKEMKMNQYQDLTSRTAPHFDDILEGLVWGAMGISSEAGEVVGVIDKSVYKKHPWNHKDLAYELGDVLYFIARLANDIGYSLDEIAVMNQQKLYKRYPNGFNSEDSINRKE
jgi:NTP pyrophosphatase (non-canonical NTP hydrolase)